MLGRTKKGGEKLRASYSPEQGYWTLDVAILLANIDAHWMPSTGRPPNTGSLGTHGLVGGAFRGP